MQDRVSLYPGRVKLVPVPGQENTYDMVRADSPTQEGMPLNKANLLSDDAEISLFGVTNDRTVSEAFAGIGSKLKLIMSDMASITVTVTDQAGNAVKNALVEGIYSDSGSAVYTNASGVASGYIAEGSQTISVKNYADLEDISKTLTVVKGSTIVETLTPTRVNFVKLTASKSVKFSGDVTTVDVTVVGGGGAAGTSCASDSSPSVAATGGSGAGGDCIVQDNIQITSNTAYPAVIGSGGTTTSSDGNDGGKSSFLGVEAAGGKGGKSATTSSAGTGQTGNGNGVSGRILNSGYTSLNGKDGIAGTVDGYDSFTTTTKFGGSGGTGGVCNTPGSASGGAGARYGGDGGGVRAPYGESGSPGQDGFGGGGGSAGAFYAAYSTDGGVTEDAGSPAKGGSGCVTMRIHFDFGDLSA